jgi:polyisoprenoid-binding protein YceI
MDRHFKGDDIMKMLILLASILSFGAHAADNVHTWEVDPNHASVVFKIDHLGFSNVYGMIPGLQGTIVWDETNPAKSTFDFKLDAAKITTMVQKRDDHLHSPDFFNVKQFPTIQLKSKSVKKVGKAYDVTGDLTLHGVTKTVKFVFHRMNTGKDPWGGTRTGGGTTFKIKRSDYKMTFMNKPGEVGDEVEVTVNLEAVQK